MSSSSEAHAALSLAADTSAPKTAGRTGPSRVQSVDRAAVLLRAVAAATGPSRSATALAEACGLNRTTTWRILSTLEQHQLVTLDRETGWYSLGFGFLDLASEAGTTSVIDTSRPVLHRVAAQTGETAALAILRDGALTYVAEAGAGSVVAAAWQGRQVPLHATSTGKALLAFSDSAQIRDLLGLPGRVRLPRHTPTTITSLAALEQELDLTRSRGFGVCRGEFETSAWGVSAPVLSRTGRPVAVVSIWGPSERLTEAHVDALGRIALAAADEIAGRQSTEHPAEGPG